MTDEELEDGVAVYHLVRLGILKQPKIPLE